MNTLLALVNELETKLEFIERKREAISQVTVGWHMEHSLLAMIKMISAMEHSTPADYKWRFNVKRTVVLLMNKIPRGRAKTPDAAKPAEMISKDTVIPILTKAKQKAESFEKLSPDKFFTHHVFGDLRVKQARRIITIHTCHHIKIINDILGK